MLGVRQEYTHTHSFTPRGNLETPPFNMFLGDGRKAETPEETQTAQGDHAKLHRDKTDHTAYILCIIHPPSRTSPEYVQHKIFLFKLNQFQVN